MDKLTDRLTGVADRLRGLADKFGLPEWEHTVVIKYSDLPESGGFIPVENSYTVSPNPKVESIPEKLAGVVVSGDVVIGIEDYIVTNLTKTLPAEAYHPRNTWSIDGVDGYTVIRIEEKSTGYEAIIRKPLENYANS